MEFEIFNIHTTERLLWNYIEKVPDQSNFDNILTFLLLFSLHLRNEKNSHQLAQEKRRAFRNRT
ncbi:hypothetical protein A616_19140 [Brevibacillus brevis X23]|nr:hypothetical protein A616_19140 [Brevibacillus brevis X23]